MPKKQLILGYVPVLHRGYMDFFKAYPDAKELYVFGNDVLKKIDYIRKDLRALAPLEQKRIIAALGLFDSVKIADQKVINDLDSKDNLIIMPDEDISRDAASKFKYANTEFYPVFLRWDRRNVENLNAPDDHIKQSNKKADVSLMKKAYKEATKSSDIWRRIGAVLVLPDGREYRSHNQAEPNQHSPLAEGDPRNIFNRGTAIEMSVFTHAEATLIAQAAHDGFSLEGAFLYVTTFPCPACAKLIARSGIKTCYYVEGYSILDGLRVLEGYGTKAIKVKMPTGPDDYEHPKTRVPYSKN